MQAEAIAIVNAIEEACDTGALRYRGARSWPLARLRLMAAVTQRIASGRNTAGAAPVTNTGPSFTAAPDAQAELVGPTDLGLLRAAGRGAVPPARAEILFFARPEEHSDRTATGMFAKTLDSVLERVSGPALKLELADQRTLGFPRAHPSLFIDLARAGAGVAFDPPGTLSGLAAVNAAAERIAGVTLDQAQLLADMGKIFYFARIFEKLLRALGPKAFILSVYYHPVGMAWMLACHWAGVTSVDLQHGRLGPHHGFYTDLIAAPAEGYELMPDRVWCWGQRTVEDIARALNPACMRHRGFVGGNAWLHKWRYGDVSAFAPPALDAFTERLKGLRVILVSLQPLDTPVPPALLEAMGKAPADWFWLLRLHPLRRHTAPEIAALLARAGVTRFEMEAATAFPLFTLLRHADHHVTAFSSVTVEAAAFDLRTSLTSPDGEAIFAPEIARGICRYTPTADALLNHIGGVLSQARGPLDSDFIDMSPGAVDRALATITQPKAAA
ncbi:MAG: hypothetical protein K1X51_08575 [Rhodospirillaceae bacterium]|nr:hypothetical protein [Rhodospirillaceae bacterium]